jgi:phosphohistidine phosphatase
MKTLFLLRHASAESSDGDDHARILTARGRDEAAHAATCLAALEPQPALALCSPAQRALETLDAMLERLPDLDVTRDPELYLASAGEILDRVQALPETLDAALVVGHNPGLAALARSLAGEAGDAERALLVAFPPAALAVLAFPTGGWPDLAPGRGRLLCVRRPDRERVAG